MFSVHWIVPIIGTAFFAPGFYLTFQSVLNYLGESYPRYIASVFAGNTFFRSSFGGALPLAAPQMLKSLGIGWSSSTLGFISVAMLPLPFILERVRYLHGYKEYGGLANSSIVWKASALVEQVRQLVWGPKSFFGLLYGLLWCGQNGLLPVLIPGIKIILRSSASALFQPMAQD